jgi:hypothetical protein
MNDGGNVLWGVLLVAFLIIGLARGEAKRKRRADYNRKIGEPDLAAPLPSEMYAAQRSGPRKVIWAMVIIVLLIFFGWPLLIGFAGLLAVIGGAR